MRAWPLTDVEGQIPRVPRTARGNPVRLACHAIGKKWGTIRHSKEEARLPKVKKRKTFLGRILRVTITYAKWVLADRTSARSHDGPLSLFACT
jgi:hypothetical protein